jgi:hypothetical protein
MARFKFTRDWYLPKHPSAIIHNKADTAVVYLVDDGRPVAMGFYGRQAKPAFHRSYRTPEARSKDVAAWFDSVARRDTMMADRRAARKAFRHDVKLGDVFNTCWGYDQTNIDYYQVTKLVGDTMVEVRQIGCESVETAWLQGQSVPVPNSFVGDAVRCRVGDGNYLTIDGHHASRTEYREIAGARVYHSRHWTAYH